MSPEGDVFHVKSKVEAKNALGVELTYRWETFLFLENNTWELGLCVINGETVYVSEQGRAKLQAKVEAKRMAEQEIKKQEAKKRAEEKAQEDKQRAEEKAREAVKNAPERLKDANQLVAQCKEAKAKERHEEASSLFQKATEIYQGIITAAPQTQAATEAKKLIEEARSLHDGEKTEEDAARKLALPKRLVQDGKTEKAKGNTREADALFEKAKLRLQDIIKSYPKTKAAAEASELLDKLD